MKRRALFLSLANFFLFCTMATAGPNSEVVGDARSIYTKYTGPFNVNLEKWSAAHPVGWSRCSGQHGSSSQARWAARVASLIVLGAPIGKTAVVSIHSMEKAIEVSVPKKTLSWNVAAFRRGLDAKA